MCGVAPPHPFLLILRANWSDEPVLINIKETEMVKGTCTYASDEESAERNYQRIRPYCKLHSLIADSCSHVSGTPTRYTRQQMQRTMKHIFRQKRIQNLLKNYRKSIRM